MIYRDFQDLKLSALGMGAMRLPVINGDDGNVDEKSGRGNGRLRHGAWSELLRYGMGLPQWAVRAGDGKGSVQIPQGEFLSCHKVPGIRPLQHGQGRGNL